MTQYSYSRVQCFAQCPMRYKFRYVDRLKTIPETNADNALYLGLGLHKGIETGNAELGVAEYQSHFNILTDDVINYSIQLEYQIPRVINLLPEGGDHELEINADNFIGFVDYVCGDTLFDFKFTNNIDNYLKSPQLSIYKYYLEQVRLDIQINHLKYVFVSKVGIRQKHKDKPPETLNEYRNRLYEHLEATEIKVIEIDYDNDTISDFKKCCQVLDNVKDFPKKPTRLCGWCDYQEYCESNGTVDYMIMNN